MKVEELPGFMLAPLEGRDDEAWFRAPPGKWSPGEIVDHIAIAIERSAEGWRSRLDKPAMTRRPRSPFQRIAWLIVGSTGWFPGRRIAPEPTRPSTRPDRAATEQRLRNAAVAYASLRPALGGRTDVFLKHPVFGDLTYDEYSRFHFRHVHHHRKQLIERLGAVAR